MATIYCTATTLDGFIADDDESLSWLFATPDHGADPQGRYGDADSLSFDTFIGNVGAVAMGANTCEWIRREITKGTGEFTWPYEQPSWVVTHRDLDLPAGVERFAGDVATLHAQMTEAANGKDVWVVGGGDLAGQFFDAGLLDRLWLHVAPVVVESGKPLLPRRVRLHRREVERDGQLTAMLFDVVGPEPRAEAG